MLKSTVSIREKLKERGYRLFFLCDSVEADVPMIIDNFIIFSSSKDETDEFYDHVIALAYTESAATDLNKFVSDDCQWCMSELHCLDMYGGFKSYVDRTVSRIITDLRRSGKKKSVSKLINHMYNLEVR